MDTNRFPLQRTLANTFVGGKKTPAVTPYFGQPCGVFGARLEMVEMALETNIGIFESLQQMWISAVILIQKNDERI